DNKYELFEKYEATINFLDRLPQEVLTNLVEFKKQCEAKGNSEAFENGFKDLVSQGEFLSAGKNGEYTRIVNEHRFAIGSDNDVVTHSILNLNGSDLDISLTDDGRIAIINCPENMTEDQVKALADYCYKYGIEIKDFGNLKDAKVLDKNGNELGSCEVEFNKAMAENEKSHNKSEKVNVEPVERNNAVYIGESYFGDFIPEEKITRKKKKVKLLGFIDLYDAETKSGLDMDKAKASTQKFAGMDCAMYIDNRLNSTVLSVYANEDDREEDGKIDKNNKVKHTKKFAVVFHHTTPPKATMYFGPKEKITTDHARVILDTYKAQGYKYYTIPPLTSSSGFGKDGQVAFIKASVKTGMVLYLKGADGKGCNIGPADLKTILDETKAEENFINNPDQKVEYLMRWHEQLEKFAKHNPGNANELADYIGKFKNQASFTYFEKYYKGVIEDEIVKGIKGNDEEGKEPWDRVDMIAAQHALTQIVKNIQDGKLGEKRYNPLDREGNQNLIIEEFHRYMKAERKNIEKEIDYNISLIEKEKKVNNPVDTAIRKVEERYEQEFVAVKDDLKTSDVDVTIKRRKAIRGYVPNAKTSENNKLYNNIITPAYKARA
ncbi:MAG: hypothetical protein IKA30_05035, partial [Alphaproteobacteria bacterium]|nr:hypothetical protein [Alphaproteobacteria bacterium]